MHKFIVNCSAAHILPGVNGVRKSSAQSTERDFRFIPDNTAKRPQINKRAQITTTRTWYIPLIELANVAVH